MTMIILNYFTNINIKRGFSWYKSTVRRFTFKIYNLYIKYLLNKIKKQLKRQLKQFDTWVVRSSHPEVFCKRGVPRNFTKFTRKHLYQSRFFNKVASLRPCEFCKISKNTLSSRTPLVTASKSYSSKVFSCCISSCSLWLLKFFSFQGFSRALYTIDQINWWLSFFQMIGISRNFLKTRMLTPSYLWRCFKTSKICRIEIDSVRLIKN